MRGAHKSCWQICADLAADGLLTEEVLGLQAGAAVANGSDIPTAWRPTATIPDSCLPDWVALEVNRGQQGTAHTIAAAQRLVHPEKLLGLWSDASFWLMPVRNWIA